MGHTLSTITNQFDRFLSHLSAFRRALRKSDQIALQDLLDEARQHLPAAGYAAHVLPEITLLLCLILEKHKQARRHENEFEKLRAEIKVELNKLRNEFALQAGKARMDVLLNGNRHEPRGKS